VTSIALRSLRAVVAAVVLLPVSIAVSSCVSVFGLNDYAEAAETLCEHLVRCFGESAYPDCYDHVASGVTEGSPEERAAWLGSIEGEECLAKCSSGVACLDAAPVCNASSEGCGQAEHCCGFLDNAQACEGGSCCRQDGQLCDGPGQCCTDCSAETGTCGGARPCAPQGELCELPEDCCSDNCDPMTGRCDFRCRELFEDCDGANDCCSGACGPDGRCACVGPGGPCDGVDECCSGTICLNGACDSPPECLPPNNLCGPGDMVDCCATPGGTPIPCSPEEGLCCFASGTNVGFEEGEFCCGGQTNAMGFCCHGPQGPCKDDSDCCGAAACQDQACCNQPGCPAGPCDVHPYPLARTGSNGNPACTDMPPQTIACINAVCDADAYCCCVAWDAMCVAQATPGNPMFVDVCATTCITGSVP
jgi:hypothetical protein